MNTAVNVNVVHESEAQRQFARVRMPAKIRYATANKETVDQQVDDLSAGGFSFVTSERQPVKVGDYHKAKLLFLIDNLSLGLDVEFQVVSVDPNSRRAGCQFHNLRPQETAALRSLITAHLSGELVNVGDILATLQRDNFTKARKGGGDTPMGPFARLRAVTVSAAVLAVGVTAFAYIFSHLYDHYFITHADAGQVAVPHLQVTMPREGTVTSLVPPSGVVEKGAPVATFSTTMLEMLRNSLSDEQLTPENVETLFSRQLQGTLTSPCDCRVVQQLVADGQFATKGAPIFELAPADAEANVEARFRYTSIDKVQPGTPVSMRVSGESEERTGRIVSAVLQDGGLSSDIRVTIQPDAKLSSDLAGRPVDVVIGGSTLTGLADKAVAAGF